MPCGDSLQMGDGRKIDGKRVLVDVERGRTVPNWRPRRLGGGLGNSRVDPKAPVPPPPEGGSGGGGGGGGGGQERTEEVRITLVVKHGP